MPHAEPTTVETADTEQTKRPELVAPIPNPTPNEPNIMHIFDDA